MMLKHARPVQAIDGNDHGQQIPTQLIEIAILDLHGSFIWSSDLLRRFSISALNQPIRRLHAQLNRISLVVHYIDIQTDSSISVLSRGVAKFKRALVATAFGPTGAFSRTTVIRTLARSTAPILFA